MFEDVSAEDLLTVIGAHELDVEDPPWERAALRIDAIAGYERLIRVAQARMSAEVAALAAERERSNGIGDRDAALSVIGEVAMARGISPTAAGTQYGHAVALARLPQVSAAFEAGTINQATAQAISRESEAVCRDDTVLLDAALAPHLDGLTPGRAARLTRHLVIDIDAEAARARAEANRSNQHVSLLPDADGVAILQVRGPAEQIVAAHRALDTWARGLRSTGDERTTGQIMTQTLVERVTGTSHSDHLDVEIGIVVGAETLVGADDVPAEIDGYGPVPASLADDIIGRSHRAFYRRLVTDPVTDQLIGRDPRRRRFDGPLAGHVRARDRRCRQPGCDHRIRELDHIHAWTDGGPTTADNAQGLCSRSHTIKHLPGWTVTADGRWRTPTGHTYRAQPEKYLVRRRL